MKYIITCNLIFFLLLSSCGDPFENDCVNPATPDFEGETEYTEGENIYLYVKDDQNTSVTEYQWKNPEGIISKGNFLIINKATTKHSGKYTLTAIQNNCKSTPKEFEIIVNELAPECNPEDNTAKWDEDGVFDFDFNMVRGDLDPQNHYNISAHTARNEQVQIYIYGEPKTGSYELYKGAGHPVGKEDSTKFTITMWDFYSKDYHTGRASTDVRLFAREENGQWHFTICDIKFTNSSSPTDYTGDIKLVIK